MANWLCLMGLWCSILMPSHIQLIGNAGSNHHGQFRMGEFTDLRVFIGTEPTQPAPTGRLVMYFDRECLALGTNDFVVKTSSESFGPLGGPVRLVFYEQGKLRYSIDKTIAPDKEISTAVKHATRFDRVELINIAPDPPGINNLAGVTLDNAWCVRANR